MANRVRPNQMTGLSAIYEEPVAEFRDYFGKKQLKQSLKLDMTSSEPSRLDELLYLKRNFSLVSSAEHKAKLQTELDQKRDDLKSQENKKFDIFHNRVYADRNPVVNGLTADVRKDPGLSQLQDELKKEFDMFLTTTLLKTTESLRSLSRPGSDMQKNNEWTFLTQENEVFDEPEEELENLMKANNISANKDKNSEMAVIEKRPSKNWQVAVVDDEKNETVVKLNKILESIKRIDLPKFQPELHQICQYGSDPELLGLYSAELDVCLNREKNGLGRFCIHECCVKGNVTMLKGMLPFIDDINKLDNNQQTAAHLCAKFNELECLKILYANGVNLELPDKFGIQAVHIAAQQNHTDIVEFLFEIGVSFNSKCHQGKIPIHYAAEFGSFETLKILTNYYVDVSMIDNDQNTVGHLAAKNDHLNCVKYLISVGLPVDIVRNNKGRNVAHVCCINGSIRTLHWLLENGINKEILDDAGNNLAASCCVTGQAECFNCCVQHDVPVNLLNFSDETPLDIARKCGKSCHIEKAACNQVRCAFCVKNAIKIKILKESQSQLAGPSTITFDTAQLKPKHKRSMNATRMAEQEQFNNNESRHARNSEPKKRDFIAQYFGPSEI